MQISMDTIEITSRSTRDSKVSRECTFRTIAAMRLMFVEVLKAFNNEAKIFSFVVTSPALVVSFIVSVIEELQPLIIQS